MPSFPDQVSVRQAQSDDHKKLGAGLARAFETDPLWRWLAPSDNWSDAATRWFSTYVRFQIAHSATVFSDEQSRGVAVWLPPGQWKGTFGEAATLLAPSLRLFTRRTIVALKFLAEVERRHPTHQDHWYLGLLGTDPAHQGSGVGAALITEVTSRCDIEGIPAFLESSNEDNLGYYARFGFEVTDEIQKGDSPTLWQMWRDPR